MKKVLKVVNLLFFLLAIVLSIFNIHQRFFTNQTTDHTTNVDLQDIQFPLRFSILVNPGFSQNNLWSAGYYNPYSYFRGTSRFGGKMGWAGHNSEGGTVGSVSGIKRVCVSARKVSSIFSIISSKISFIQWLLIA